MKNIIGFFLILFCTHILVAQDKKHAVAFELYSPIHSTSSWGFYNDNMAFGNITSYSTAMSRNYFSNALGISYEYQIKQGLILRPRVGITFRNLHEERNGPYHNTYIKESYDYQQKHFNAFLGLAKRFNLFKNFSLDFGIDLCASYYQNAETDVTKTFYYTDPAEPTNEALMSQFGSERQHSNDPSMLIAGAGFYLKPEYTFSNNIFVAAELQMYFAGFFANDRMSYTYDYEFPSTGVDHHYDITYDYKIKQWGWTALSPLVRVGYKF